jgi:hypothetical protein
VVSGIVESIDCKQPTLTNLLPSATDLRKARRLAARLGSQSSCNECKRARRKCGDTRPCDRCIAIGQSNLCVSGDTKGKIERPLGFSISILETQPLRSLPPIHIKHRWAAQTVLAFWSTGYKDSSYLSMFNNLPQTMSIAMDNLLTSLERYKRETDTSIRLIPFLPVCHRYVPYCWLLSALIICWLLHFNTENSNLFGRNHEAPSPEATSCDGPEQVPPPRTTALSLSLPPQSKSFPRPSSVPLQTLSSQPRSIPPNRSPMHSVLS